MNHSFLLFSKKISIALLILIFGINLSVKAGRIIYVNQRATGANDGTSWGNAYLTVQDALNDAQYGDEIWVAEGIYKPTSRNDCSATFLLKGEVHLYGGFKGNETQVDQRKWNVYITVLSGDLNGDDDINFSNCNDNVYHVVTGVSSAIIDGFVIQGGYARGKDPLSSGAGMYNKDASNLTIKNCTFTLNIAENGGGGIHNYRSSTDITSCFIIRNRAKFGAAIHNNDNCLPNIKNCILAINQATGTFPNGSSGGAICNTLSSSPVITNCTFQGNIASHGTSISNYSSSCSIKNCIIWGGSGAGGNEIYNATNTSSVNISYSDVQGGSAGISGGSITLGSNIINTDPAYISYFHNDFRLKATSSCIDAAGTGAPNIDIYGVPRPKGNGPDMGACEYYENTGIIYVNINAQGANNGTSWADAYTRLHSALSEASYGRQIWVAKGTYHPLKYDNRNPCFYLKPGVELYGGFSGNETLLTDRNCKVNLTELNGNTPNEEVIWIISTVGANNAIIDGFTLQAGNGKTGCSFNNGVSDLKINNCVFNRGYGNQGGAMYNAYCTADINSCVFNTNTGNWGGAVHNNEQTYIKFINSVFYNNIANRYGGAICSWVGASVELMNCTFFNNIVNAGDNCEGGAIANGNNSVVSAINCIFWNNSDQKGNEIWNSDNSAITLDYCDIEGGSGKITGGQINYLGHNINSIPNFVAQGSPQGTDNIFATSDDGLQLYKGSQCIDAGTSTNAPKNDIVGNVRPVSPGSGIDMGAYEGGVEKFTNKNEKCFCLPSKHNLSQCFCIPIYHLIWTSVVIVIGIIYVIVKRYRRRKLVITNKN